MPGRSADEALLAAALDYAVTSAAEIRLGDLGRRSACAGWTVAEALAHLTRSLRSVATSLAVGVVPADPAPTPSGPVTARTLRRDLGRAAAALGAAVRELRGRRSVAVDGLPLPCHQLIVVGALEAAVHGWDAARARPIPEDLAVRLLAELPAVLDRDTRRGMFAEPVVLAPDRPAAERLLAVLGRDPLS
ncbi:maleylpyruvate isomerase family mycothiol-dependent enzyme [Amycolatopsis sp. A133]|uniref:maleylpyruvate isomerase family mycothiol-dependent enzyme n=1 Tax=Amycolatopsis sp. A133 TaxID=3064472 RepID=UPI0027F258BF|nr:maleylpyruvate isomerase family mycothiol-dependent enzyme [Amycolatopsis sp. A133]MDQ7803014.1 maleylpyruvate isomerase family mycothiol-dependent enzyme [Amycolatopsis sp. A133]